MKGNFKFAYSNKRDTFYKTYISKLLMGPSQEDVMSAIKEFHRKSSHPHIPEENIKSSDSQPMGIFSFKKPGEVPRPKRPSTNHDQYKSSFRKKMINSLISKLINQTDQDDPVCCSLDDPEQPPVRRHASQQAKTYEIKVSGQTPLDDGYEISPIMQRKVFLPIQPQSPIVREAAASQLPLDTSYEMP